MSSSKNSGIDTMEQRYLVVTFDGFRRMGQRFFHLLLFRWGRRVAATQDGSCFDMMRLKGDDAEIASFSSPSPPPVSSPLCSSTHRLFHPYSHPNPSFVFFWGFCESWKNWLFPKRELRYISEWLYFCSWICFCRFHWIYLIWPSKMSVSFFPF